MGNECAKWNHQIVVRMVIVDGDERRCIFLGK